MIVEFAKKEERNAKANFFMKRLGFCQAFFVDKEKIVNIKQVIVVRTKYPNDKGGVFSLRSGKMIAQACHASISFICKKIDEKKPLNKVEKEWINGNFAKICLQVDTEEELVDVFNKAKTKGLEVHMITDSGKTEFHGIPTKTCLAIGPDYADKIDEITGSLKLY